MVKSVRSGSLFGTVNGIVVSVMLGKDVGIVVGFVVGTGVEKVVSTLSKESTRGKTITLIEDIAGRERVLIVDVGTVVGIDVGRVAESLPVGTVSVVDGNTEEKVEITAVGTVVGTEKGILVESVR